MQGGTPFYLLTGTPTLLAYTLFPTASLKKLLHSYSFYISYSLLRLYRNFYTTTIHPTVIVFYLFKQIWIIFLHFL